MPPVRDPGKMPDLKRPKRARKKPPRAAPRTEHVELKPKAKPKAPSPRQVKQAEAQEAQYVSQGRAVKKAAKQQKRAAHKTPARVPGLAQAREQQRAIEHVPKAQQPKVLRKVRARQAETNLPEPKREKLHLLPGAKPPKNSKLRMQAGSVADLSGPVAAIAAAGKAGTKLLAKTGAPEIVQNIPKDAAELAVTTPSSIAKLAVTAATDPEKIPGMLAQPYKDLAKDPGKFITEHPVSTVLMLEPGRRLPGQAAGKVARVTGKQTLARPAATLPGSVLKEARTGSRGVVRRAHQARKDVKRGAPTMSAAGVQRRADEFYDFEQHHVQRATASATRKAQTKAKAEGKTKAQTREFVKEQAEGASAGAKTHEAKRKFTQEFGAPHVRDADGRVVKPENATGGALHNSREAAQAVADHLNAKNVEIERGAHGLHQVARRKTKVPLEFTVRDAGYQQFAAVPKMAAERLDTHRAIGTSKALGAREMRVAGRSFRNAVLPLSARWLTGQAVEAGFRATVARAGPADALRFKKVVKRMNQAQKGSGDEFKMRVTGGQFDLTGTAREFAHGRSLAEEFKGSALEDPAHYMTKAATTKPAMAVRKGWQRYTNVVFNTVNGFFEQTARNAMAGQAIRQGPLMEKRLLGLTDRALEDAAKGLKGTDAQVQVSRAVDRMYGQYQKFSPDKREKLLHTTPFYPWYRNMVTFLTQTLPVDHPLQAALVADLDAATEEWRKAHKLSLRSKDRKPGFLQGGYPTESGGVKRIGRYLPFMPADPVEAGASLFWPQYGNTKAYLTGIDWKGDPVKGSRLKAAAGSLAQAHIPGAGQGTRIVKKVKGGKALEQALADEVAPLPTTKGGAPKKKLVRKRKPAAGGYPGFGGGGSGGSSSGYPGF